jgi:hypothetical protein
MERKGTPPFHPEYSFDTQSNQHDRDLSRERARRRTRREPSIIQIRRTAAPNNLGGVRTSDPDRGNAMADINDDIVLDIARCS